MTIVKHSPDGYRPKEKEPRYSLEQQHAIDLCCDLSQTIVGVTGGAGTGKTLVLGRVYRSLTNLGVSVVLCAPTGRAAKRIQELTGIKAKTIHRLLEFPMPEENPDDIELPPNEPKRNRGNRLVERVVIVDESSMIAPALYRQLLDALRNDGAVRFFGDNQQLPPVEVEEDKAPPFVAVLEDYPSVTLTFNYRSEDFIVSNAMRILNGTMPSRNAQFEIIYSEDPLMQLLQFVKDAKEFTRADHQIIMPTRRGNAGTIRINPSLQAKFNPKGDILRLDRYDEKEAALTIRGGDKFLWIKNDHKLNMFNGEIGRVNWVDTEDGSLELQTPDRSLLVPALLKTFSPWHGHLITYDPRKQIELGYAVTTHKSQGSEFDVIVYCISRKQAFLLNRRNFYTAVTRAKKRVIVITDRKAMGLSLRRYKPV